MNFISRRELYVTMDIMKLNKVINLLKEGNIKFSYKTQNTTYQHGRVIGLNSKGMFLYYIYVHKNDLKKAQLLIKNI